MELMKCKTCSSEVSKNAKVCPTCGEPIKKKTSLFTWLILIGFILYVVGMNKDKTSINYSNSSITSKRTEVKRPTKEYYKYVDGYNFIAKSRTASSEDLCQLAADMITLATSEATEKKVNYWKKIKFGACTLANE